MKLVYTFYEERWDFTSWNPAGEKTHEEGWYLEARLTDDDPALDVLNLLAENGVRIKVVKTDNKCLPGASKKFRSWVDNIKMKSTGVEMDVSGLIKRRGDLYE